MEHVVRPVSSLIGTVQVPSDKSIAHRAAIVAAISDGTSRIERYPHGQDNLSTISCLNALGVETDWSGDTLIVHGRGIHGLKEPDTELDCGNSGTTMRLMAGLLASQRFDTTLTGDASLTARPMERVAGPLREMGADIRLANGRAPIRLHGTGPLRPINHVMAVPSAQVKSAIVLAALTANGATTIVEPQPSRDHTERMLDLEIETSGSGQRTIVVHPVTHLLAVDTMLPGDISSAAFFVVAASIVADSRIVIEHVGINPTRTGFLDVLERAGARISLSNKSSTRGEWVADIVVESAQLESLTITRGIVPRLIDEIPVLAIAAARANGLSRFDGIGELRAKESDRLDAIGAHLTAFGVPFTDGQDWLEVSGHSPIRSATVAAYHDHRMAMSAAIAGLVAAGPVTVKDAEVASVSFPDFYEILDSLSR